MVVMTGRVLNPGGQDLQLFLRGRTGRSPPGDELLVGVTGPQERGPLDGEITEVAVADGFGAELLLRNIASAPPSTELRVCKG